jgi:predicted RNA binding protein with dsRBD fold (UPF0201 family)
LVPELKARVSLKAGVSPSEDPDKVAQAVMNIVGSSSESVSKSGSGVRFHSARVESLGHLRDQLRDRRVRAVARRLMLEARQGNRTELMINRQAAAAGVLALCGSEDESPLGPIYLRIESENLDRLIEWLTAYEGG